MPSSLTWLDHDNAARERSLRILALFKEKESRDELGIGGIRDAIADRLFPGTSTIQTRLRYTLLVPWVYQSLESRRVSASQFAARARQEELALVGPLIDEREHGVFGSQSRSGLKRLPSSVYWSGLGVWGIRRFQGAQQEYHRAVDKLYLRRSKHSSFTGDERRDPEDRHPDTLSESWHPRLPPPPEGFPSKVDLRLTKGEASFLVDRIVASCGDSLLAWLVIHGEPADVAEPWLHPQALEFPQAMLQLLHHARLFADLVEGAARVYNLALAEFADNAEFADTHRVALDEWRARVNLRALDDWSLGHFWQQTEGFGHSITPAAKHFVESWVERVRICRGDVTDDEVARNLVRNRERTLKGLRSRFENRGALAQWSGNSGTGRLVYRWPTVRNFLADLFAAQGAT